MKKRFKRVIRITDPELRLLVDKAFARLLDFGYEVRLTKEYRGDTLIFSGLDIVDLKFLRSDIREAFRQAHSS